MQYGHFDNKSREYVIDRVDLPVSWTNYIGVGDMYGVFNHTAGGYLLHKTPEYHRITRFHPNGVPMDGPGHYIYIRDDETGDEQLAWFPESHRFQIPEDCHWNDVRTKASNVGTAPSAGRTAVRATATANAART